MRAHGRTSTGWFAAVMLVLALAPRQAAGISLILRDVVDPVPAGGILTYEIRVNGASGDGTPEAFCFNPPPQCVSTLAICAGTPPQCVGNSFTGWSCTNAANEGTDCGVGDPPVADASICIPGTQFCDGGINNGLPCATNLDCPGNTCVCEFSFNQDAFCCSGIPPQPDSTLCLANPTGICSAGPNIGQVCTAPHMEETAECPPQEESASTEIVVTLPIPPEATFLGGDIEFAPSGAVFVADAAEVTFTLPPLDPCGVPGTPQCPLLTAEFTIDPATPIGTVIENQATATSSTGTVTSSTSKTTVDNFALKRCVLGYPHKAGRDKFVYKTLITFGPSMTVDPANQSFRIQVDTPSASIIDFTLGAGDLLPSSSATVQYKNREPGLRLVKITEIAPLAYSLRVRGRKMNLPPLDGLNITVTISIGNNTLADPLSLTVKNKGRKFVALKN